MSDDLCWSTYDPIAADYDEAVPHFFDRPAAHLVSLLPIDAGQRILDVASGTGSVINAIDRIPGVVVIGVDLSLPMLLRARRPGIGRLALANLLQLPFADRGFDHVTASFVLNHLEHPEAALREMARVIRPAGSLAATTWSSGPSDNVIGAAWSEIASRYVPTERLASAAGRSLPSEERLRNCEGISAMVRSAGLRVLHCEAVELTVGMATTDYIASRHISMPARFMRSVLSPEKWNEFQNTATAALLERFGPAVRFRTAINFAVAGLFPRGG